MVTRNAQLDWPALVRRLFELGEKKTFHVNDLTEIAVKMEMMPLGETPESLSANINSYMYRNSKSKTPDYSRVKNTKGGYSRGVYRIRPQKAFDLTPKEIPKVSTQFTGSAGEYAVLSELLFRGYNASKMIVDDGIDVVASRDEKYFHIQVKTANYFADKPFQATISEKAFRHSTNVFYIIVLRAPMPVGFVNRYAIIPSSDIRRLITQGILKDAVTISLRISIENQKYILNGTVDISHHVNDWDSIC
jgi:uncharacterized protein with HEPN domain